ncbi:MAG: diiron oxygenase [Actinobacteria bacterium]|nr:diiron oxygenase [Actinomycetota bacterium]MBO0834591.1 diiron oxygenase [Actinomycetota bacterium]
MSPTATYQERVADRLLRATATKSYDPDVDIDWSAPLEPGKGYVLPHRCSLYGTALWEQLSPEQRIELGKHELASAASTGIWLELLLMRVLAKRAYLGDPVSKHIQYALTELGEECRHTIMFARMIDKLGTPVYGPSAAIKTLGTLVPAIATGPTIWAGILIGEEIPDRFQREQAGDDSIQPLVRMVNRIHIVEESRHISFARTELPRSVAACNRAELAYHRLLIARFAFTVSRSFISPLVYRSVGLDPRAARAVALANPHHRETLKYFGEKLVSVLTDNGLIGSPGLSLWRRSFLLP